MSLSTLSTLAIQRDKSVPRRTKRKPKNADETQETEQQTYVNVLVSAIPTEPLALYTFLTAGIVATIETGENQRLTLRWIIYAAMIVFIAAWLGVTYLRGRQASEKKRRFPVAETTAAVIAFASWGLVMPESPLNAEISGDDRIVWTLIITVAGVALLLLLGVPLKEKAKT